ncbi:type II toxin-antitoxin system RelE/ParE family toxin [Streptomyces sp. NPDC088747]|uniref:type II toxin-antitoxin system RelE/ParE family toxin n=1 Tax=Streptomyces sp. NPDC088747 TaxID=3365886 RepID=UPI0038228279
MEGDLWAIELEPEVVEWLDRLSETDLARVDYYAGRLADEGPSMSMPRSKPLGGGLYELRFAIGDNEMRISYWFASDQRIVLLTVFRKTRMNEAGEVSRARDTQQRCAAGHPPADDHHVFSRTIKGGSQS